jgi:hypothetical protein
MSHLEHILRQFIQEVLERTNLPTFLKLFNNSALNLKHFIQKLLRVDADQQTEI